MRQLWLLVALASGGCNSILGINELTITDAPPGTEEIDAPRIVDAGPDAANEECFGSPSFARVCFAPTMHPALTLPATINTDTGCARVLAQTNGPEICVFIGQSITVSSSNTTVSGSRALMLAASGSIVIDGDLEVGSVQAGRVGPGANPASPACTTPTAGGNDDQEGGGGGAGGSFGSPGANGADGRDGGGAAGASGGLPASILGLRGGCPGSQGGTGEGAVAASPGVAGGGGGAVYLVAGTTITISGEIDASGGGGSGATSGKSGGGGGGSGGMIVLEAAMTIAINSGGEVFANGGGGGEGAIFVTGRAGDESTAYNDPGNAGAGGSGGGDGGAGAFQLVVAGPGNLAPGGSGTKAGGGAGGGGLGVIRTKATSITGSNANRISPLAVPF